MIVLDTHALVWAYGDSKQLSAGARTALEAADTIGVPAICIWEMEMLVNRGRLDLSMPTQQWVRTAFSEDSRLSEIKLDSAIALRAARLEREGLGGDPADQMILASADFYGAQLITRDRRLLDFAPDRTVWDS